jgi:hypothetical protein
MGVFVIYMGPLSCFDCINFKVSLVIKIIKFNRIKNMAHLVTLVFHVNAITCQIFNLQHFYSIFAKNPHF